MTRRQVASLFNVSVDTVIRWEQRGRLTPVKLPGGLVRYEPDEVDALRDAA